MYHTRAELWLSMTQLLTDPCVVLEEVVNLLVGSVSVVFAQSQRVHRLLDEFTFHCS